MSDTATHNNAARVLATIAPDLPADAALRKYFIHARRVGPREKRAISQAVFTYFRWLNWLDLKQSVQKQVAEALALQERFNKNPASIKAEALAARAVPEWSRAEIDWPADSLRQLQKNPSLWLRARPGTAHKLAAQLGNSEVATKHSPDAVRFSGPQDLFLTPEFHNGAFEIQDLASQLVGLAAAPLPGQTWWDTCAGEGGKSLHLADQMLNKGVLWASDRSERRLQTLKKRFARAKLFNVRIAPWDGSAKLPTKTKFDGILVDAPCSGTGTWQRNPHARWTASTKDVTELAVIQRQLLENVAGSLKPGGRLVYAVCTLTKSETTAIASAFTAAHPELEPVPVFPNARQGSAEKLSSPACAVGETDLFSETQAFLWPHQLDANGMFIATWRKK
ncbi:MAG: RsmB/NOP family class I SAM-dependent RNA methyltransferase [Nibricoccus sp.]